MSERMRIGDVAAAVGTTTRTIRYYEEIGLLGTSPKRESGKHREYTESDVERLREVMRMRDLLGVSLDELKMLVEAEESRAALREEWQHDDPDPARRAEIAQQALAHLDRQLELVQKRKADISTLEASMLERRALITSRIEELADERESSST
jgi:DNA-binding transcriptional MerR regulator